MPDLTERAALYHSRALAHCERGRFDLADRGLRLALELLDHPQAAEVRAALELKVRILSTLSTVEVELRRTTDGAASADRLIEAREIAGRLGDPAIVFAVDNARALQTLRAGDHERALEAFAAAESHIAAASANDASIFYLNRGNLRLQRLELAAARRDLDRCVGLAGSARQRDDKLRVSEFMARHNLGYLEFLAGNLPRALELMDSAAAMQTEASLAISALDKARVLIEAGLSDAADAALAGAAQAFRRGRLNQELAETELARAECAVLAGDLRAARTLAGSARTRFRRRGNDRWRRVAELALLAADQADGRPPSRLVGPAERLTREFLEQGLTPSSRTAALIACGSLAAAGRLEEAEARLAELGRVRHADPIALRLQQRAVAADLLRREGRSAPARRQIRIGLADLSRHQAQFGSIDLQTAAAIHGRALVELDLELALADGRPAAVFDAIERGRAVSRRLTAVTPPPHASADLLAELRSLTEQLKIVGDDPDSRGEAEAMRARTAELYDELSAISWRAVGPGAVSRPAAMPEVVQAAATAGKVVVSFCPGRRSWSAVVLGGRRARLVRLPGVPGRFGATVVELSRRVQADLNVLAYRSVPTSMRSAVRASLERSLHRLDELLIAPLDLGSRPLVLVPTGPTVTLPWNCLPSLRGRPVEISPTASSWLAGVADTNVTGPVSVAAIAGPGLETADTEVATVVAAWHDTAAVTHAVTGGTAGRLALADAFGADTVVHVAAHGSHNRQNPLFSSLQLADGPLYAYEIADQRVAPHVVLSACELGQATTRPGDEALGLTRVLLQLGAQCVVAGVAQVADDLAGEVMADYHARLAAGADSATALAEATATGDYVAFSCFGSSWRAR